MRAIVVVIALLLWVSPALAEQKSAPDGFGPIKFGMTKDEAWEAIGGQGEWDGDVLIHKVGLPLHLNLYYDVQQHFRDGHAGRVIIQSDTSKPNFALCTLQLAFMLGSITSKYGVYPININDDRRGDPIVSLPLSSIYQFTYADNSYVQATLTRILDEGRCEVSISIAPPSPDYSDGF